MEVCELEAAPLGTLISEPDIAAFSDICFVAGASCTRIPAHRVLLAVHSEAAECALLLLKNLINGLLLTDI